MNVQMKNRIQRIETSIAQSKWSSASEDTEPLKKILREEVERMRQAVCFNVRQPNTYVQAALDTFERKICCLLERCTRVEAR